MSNAYLILENGTVFKGRAFGYEAEAIGELVFSTGMTGYMETLTNPGYLGQMVLQTFPLIGNYGVVPAEQKSPQVQLKAYIVREWCQEPSNFRSEGNLDTFLRENKTPGLCDIDTRALTHIIRENGSMNAMLSHTPELSEAQWAVLKGYKLRRATKTEEDEFPIRKISGQHNAGFDAQSQGQTRSVVVWDFGDRSITQNLADCGFNPVTVIKHSATADEILHMASGGLVLSDGPGDPAQYAEEIRTIKRICEKGLPIFGIGLGHQLLALARGAKTEKLPFGHRGTNQPVRETATGRVFVTKQSHGFAVAVDSLPGTAQMSYENTIDGTCEGIDYTDIPAFSIQFQPSPDTDTFGKFMKMIKKGV